MFRLAWLLDDRYLMSRSSLPLSRQSSSRFRTSKAGLTLYAPHPMFMNKAVCFPGESPPGASSPRTEAIRRDRPCDGRCTGSRHRLPFSDSGRSFQKSDLRCRNEESYFLPKSDCEHHATAHSTPIDSPLLRCPLPLTPYLLHATSTQS